MRKTNQGNPYNEANQYDNPILVDTNGLQMLLNCGRRTAVELGSKAHARVMVGSRVLWNVKKMQEYLDDSSTS